VVSERRGGNGPTPRGKKIFKRRRASLAAESLWSGSGFYELGKGEKSFLRVYERGGCEY